jgi:hypothetical protein
MMNVMLTFWFTAAALIGFLMLMMEAGRRLGIHRKAKDPDAADAGLNTIDGAVYGLLALLISFTFAGAASRFDERRHLIVEETNAIGTAYLRVNLLPEDVQPMVRQDFRDYVDARLAYYRGVSELNRRAVMADEARVHALQDKIWNESVAACQKGASPATTTLVLSSLNEMIDITTTRAAYLEMHPPLAIYVSLGILVIAGSILAGYGTASSRRRSLLHIVLFAGVMGMAVLTILDLEYPRIGLIRINATDHYLQDQRNTM